MNKITRIAAVIFVSASWRVLAGLPQVHPYQIVLRDYMGTLTTQDFTVALQPLVYSNSFFSATEDVHRVWLWHENRGYQLPEHKGLRVRPERFLLSNIESNDQVYMCPGFFDPGSLAWWALWDYPGNPHRPGTANATAIKKRAFVCAACDLMMLDAYHESGQGVRSDYMGGNLIWQSHAYLVAKDVLPTNVTAAYETGLRKIFERCESVYPYGAGGSDMECFQLVGMWYAAEAIDDDDLRARAVARARYVIDHIITPGGYEQHGGAFDGSYIGIALHFMTWAALLYDDPEITATLAGLSRLKAHLTLPEPGASGFNAQYYGPTHFNTGTGLDTPGDQWRDTGAAMKTDEAKYLIFGGRYLGSTSLPKGLQSVAAMKSDMAAWVTTVNTTSGGVGLPTADNSSSPVWSEAHWVHAFGLNFAHDRYQSGFYDAMSALKAEDSPLTLPPFLRPGNFIVSFSNHFLMAKIDGYGAIIHTGPVCPEWAGNISGLSGGALSAFWTPQTGSAILGRNGGAQFAPPAPETWPLWDTWAVHAISGTDAAGRPFSSARFLQPSNILYAIAGATAATVAVTGKIGPDDGGLTAPDNAITGAVCYAREFGLSRTGLHIRSTLTSDSRDYVAQLWEMLPLFLRGSGESTDAVIDFEVDGVWQGPTTNLTPNVTRVRTTRFGKSVLVVFDRPRNVKLSSAVFHRDSSYVRNIMIDLLENGGAPAWLPASTAVEYDLLPPYTCNLNVVGDPDEHGAGRKSAPRGFDRRTFLRPSFVYPAS